MRWVDARRIVDRVVLFIGCALMHLLLGGRRVFGGHTRRRRSRRGLGEVLRSLVGTAGAYVMCVSALSITLVLRTSFSFVAIGRVAFGAGALAALRRRMRWLRDSA